MSVLAAASRWLAGKRDLTAQVETLQIGLANCLATPPETVDIAEHRRWAQKRERFKIDLEAAQGALAIATAEHAKAEALDRSLLDADEVREIERLAASTAKQVHKLDGLLRQVAILRDKIVADDDRVCDYNSRRGTRPFVSDGETRAREKRSYVIPATFRDEVIWEDGHGRRASVFRRDEKDELVPIEAGFARKVIKVCQQQEREISSSAPERYIDALRLVSLDGSVL